MKEGYSKDEVKMKDGYSKYTVIFLMIVAFLIGLFVSVQLARAMWPTYKEGQIDALTGKVKYVLVQKPNKEMIWEEIKKNE